MLKSRNTISQVDLDRPSTWTRGERSWRVGIRNIGISGVVQLVHSGIAIRDFPIQSEPSICGTGGNHREPSAFGPIEKSEFRRHRHAGIENPETTKGNQDRPSFKGRVSVDLE
jgi:hypothetical protein